LPFTEPQNANHRGQQLVLGRLKQLVARIVGQDVGQRLGGVAARYNAGAHRDVGGLAAQQWDLGRFGTVGDRREQAEKAILTADVALGIEALDRYVVEIAWTINGGPRGRLGDDQ
jgi:hypothetical protein